jgi:hypothetical protein
LKRFAELSIILKESSGHLPGSLGIMTPVMEKSFDTQRPMLLRSLPGKPTPSVEG